MAGRRPLRACAQTPDVQCAGGRERGGAGGQSMAARESGYGASRCVALLRRPAAGLSPSGKLFPQSVEFRVQVAQCRQMGREA